MATRGKSASSKRSTPKAAPKPPSEMDAAPEAKPKVEPKKPEPEPEPEPVSPFEEAVYTTFVEHAGWGQGDEDKEKAFKEIDELIVKYEQMIVQLKQQKLDFDDRENKAREFITGMVKLFGPTSKQEAILSALYVRFDVAPPKRKRTKAATKPIDEDKLQAVFEVLDGEGMLSGDIRKALPEDLEMDAATLKAILDKLIEDGKVAKAGERRSTNYRRLDAGAPEPPPEPESEESDEDEGADGSDPEEPEEEGEFDDEE
jgi:hypothetical protein